MIGAPRETEPPKPQRCLRDVAQGDEKGFKGRLNYDEQIKSSPIFYLSLALSVALRCASLAVFPGSWLLWRKKVVHCCIMTVRPRRKRKGVEGNPIGDDRDLPS